MYRLLLLLGAALSALPIFAASAQVPADDALLKASSYIHARLQADGSYGGSSVGQNLDAILAVRAAGFDPAKDTLPGGATPADYLAANVASLTGPGAAKAALAARALGLDPTDVAGVDLIAAAAGEYDAGTGRYAADDFSQSLVMLGLACTGHDVEDAAATALRDRQLDGGGWGFGGFADADTTAIALQALLATGAPPSDSSVVAARNYLVETQAPDGGWGFEGVGNANSTAFAVQALLALGLDPEAASFTKDGVTPIDFLVSQQLPDGSFDGFDPMLAATQVIPALAGRSYCNTVDTPITRVREQQPTPIPTASASPSPATTATPTVEAPDPPSTGGGTAPGDTPSTTVPLVVLGLVLVAAGAGLGLRRS